MFSKGTTKAIKIEGVKAQKPWIKTICGIKYEKLLSYLRLELNIKVGLLPSKTFIFVYFNESPFKMIKNAQARQKIITTHILLKISTSKGN